MKPKWSGALLFVLTMGIGLSSLSCGGDDSNPVSPPGGADLTINIVAMAGANSYSANPDTVTVGQTVSWRNVASDGQTHTATDNGVAIFDTGNIAFNATSSPIQMNTVGSHGYHCGVHPAMTGTLVVRP